MPNEMKYQKFKQEHSKKRKVYAILTALAMVAGLGTVWALVQPASAMSGKLICALEEHTHTDECYERSLVCGLEEGEEHTHTDDCWQTELICQLTEHTHTEECYAPVEPESKPENQPEEAESATSQPENPAESASNANSDSETTSKPESVPDSDKNDASQPESKPDVDKNDLPQPESKPNTDKNDMSKPADKPETDKNNGTSKPESETADNSTVSKPESELEDESGLEQPEGEEETGDKFLPLIPYLDQLPKEIPAEYSDLRKAEVYGGGGHICVYARPGTLPENVEVRAHVLGEESAEFAQAVQRLNEAGVSYDFVKALDISLYNELGEKVEPEAPVYVEIEAAGLMSREADPASIRIQHHKEILPPVKQEEGAEEMHPVEQLQNAEPEVVLETVVDPDKGLLIQQAEAGSFAATFPVDQFSTFTITSEGWKELHIKVHCVDEEGKDIPDAPKDMVLNSEHTPDESFGFEFLEKKHPEIAGYHFDNKAYYMEDGHYIRRIYGLRYEGKNWYYYDKENNTSSKVRFSPQPDFYGENPKNSLRLVYKKISDIPVEYRDKEYNILPKDDAPGKQNPSTVRAFGNALDISNVDAWPKSPTYYYIGMAYVKERDPKNEIIRVITRDNKLYAVTAEEKEVELTTENPLRLIYLKSSTEPLPPRLETVPTRDKGMIINLFDYNAGDNFGPNEGVNKGKNLQFVADPKRPEDWNKWTGKDGGIYTGIVDERLDAKGYPVVKGQSLDYLFDPAMCKEEHDQNNGEGMIRHYHTNLDKLFWQDKDGYYRYDSMTNFATIMDEDGEAGGHKPGHTDGGDFIVYTQPALPGITAVGDNPKFLPFNKYSEANAPTAKPAISDKVKQYHFGMTIEANFVMPTGGVVPDAEGNHVGVRDMIFEFNGDDDVWVFIDGKLVLDLGGIHDRYGGTINFRTGEVTTNAPPMEHSGRQQPNLYGIKGDPNQLTEDQLIDAREKAGFGRFSQHNFKFFYLERGRGASNCEIRFNLVPVAHGLVVGKRITESMNAASTDHLRYQFQAEVQQPGGKKEPLANANYTIIHWEPDGDPVNGGKPVGAGKTDAQGRFWLKAGERADFTDVIDLKHAGNQEKNKVQIYISEIIPNGQIESKVTSWSGKEEVEGTYLKIPEASGIRKVVPPMYNSPGYEFHTEKTKTALNKTDGTQEIRYQAHLTSGRDNEFNWIDFENDLGGLAGLNITKKALRTSKDIPITGIPFSVKIELWDETAQAWLPLGEGAPYWILNPGETPPKKDEKSASHLPHGADGQISIQHDQTIHLKLLPGTRYRVSEVLSDGDAALYTTTYTGTVSNPTNEEEQLKLYLDDQQTDKQIGIGNQAGIKAGSTHNITITNRSDEVIAPQGALVLTKQVEGAVSTPEDTKFHFDLNILNYQPGADGSVTCTAIYHDTPAGAQRDTESETISFVTNAAGDMLGTQIFLYPGESVVITGLPAGQSILIKENLQGEQTEHYEVSFQEEGQTVVPGTEISTSPIDAKRVIRVTCTNKSKLQTTTTLQITKQVKRTDQPGGTPTPADQVKEFSFSITLKNPSNFAGGEITATVEKNGGQSSEKILNFQQTGGDYTANVTLKHGETLTIPGLPTDVDAVVQETGHDGYVVTMNKIPGDSITVHLKTNSGAPYAVTCVNATGVELPETGGAGRLPYYLLGTLMLCAAGWLLHRRRNENS